MPVADFRSTDTVTTGSLKDYSQMDVQQRDPSNSRVRQRRSIPQALGSAYQMQFSCELAGRYFRNSKRKISWLFGIAGSSISGDESKESERHRVELVWSLKSGKTRVYWNGKNISNFFREGSHSGYVDFGWETRTGETLQIIAYADASPTLKHQYDLLVDGVSFFDLPYHQHRRSEPQRHVSEGSAVEVDGQLASADQHLLPREQTQSQDEVSELGCSVVDHTESSTSVSNAGQDFDYRMSLVGISTGTTSPIEIVDELVESDSYTPIVTQMRIHITSYLPQTEETISKAITNALFVDSDSSHASDSFSESTLETDPVQIEATALWEAFQWTQHNGHCASRPDVEERALAYMQKQFEAAFVSVRQEALTATQACGMLLNVGALLGFRFARSIPANTLLLDGLARSTVSEHICDSLIVYGDILVAGVVQGHGFGFVRFEDERAARHVQSTTGCLTIAGVRPRMVVLSDSAVEGPFLGHNSRRKSVVSSPDRRSSAAGQTESSSVVSSVYDADISTCKTSPDTVTRIVDPSFENVYKPKHDRPLYTNFLD